MSGLLNSETKNEWLLANTSNHSFAPRELKVKLNSCPTTLTLTSANEPRAAGWHLVSKPFADWQGPDHGDRA